MTPIREFSSPADLASRLAADVLAALAGRLRRDGCATLAVSGGNTPIKFLRTLAELKLDWENVTVTLVDDRWVQESSPRSNAALVKKHLLQGSAQKARFLPLVNDAATPEAGRDRTEAAVGALNLPFDAVVLGMGTDGHTASFFPGGDRLGEALAPHGGRKIETMRAEAAGEPRITFTLPTLLDAGYVALHIEGHEKHRVLKLAQTPGPFEAMPVRAVLARRPAPGIYWSP